MDKISDIQIIHCLNIFLDLKQNNELLFNQMNLDDLITYIQKNW